MMQYQLVTIAGRVGRDPETRYTPGGKQVSSFSVGVSDRKNETEWFNVVMWERLAETYAPMIAKGSPVLISGKQKTRTWEGQDGQKKTRVELIANEIRMLDSKGTKSVQANEAPSEEGDEDESPF